MSNGESTRRTTLENGTRPLSAISGVMPRRHEPVNDFEIAPSILP